MRLPTADVGAEPAWSGQEIAPLGAQLVTRGGEPVLLRSDGRSRVFLGALTDRAGHVHEWLELCVTDEGTEASLAACARALATIDPGSLVDSPKSKVAAGDEHNGNAPDSGIHPKLGGSTDRLLVRRRPAAMLVECADALSDLRDSVGASSVDLSIPREVRSATGGEGLETATGFFLSHEGAWGRTLETLHLKLSLILGCCQRVASFSRTLGRPILELNESSFGVFRPDIADGMPAWWACRVTLLEMGSAEPIESLPGGFLSGRSTRSIYRGDEADTVAGTCELRARTLDELPDGGSVLSGTLQTDEPFKQNSLVRVFVPSQGDRVELLLETSNDDALSAGEVRFRAGIPESADATQLKSTVVGIPIRQLAFETIPNAGIGADLYSLGVLALRVLFGTEDRSLAETIDDLWGLARAAHEADDHESIAEAMASLASDEPRWRTGLGPQRLLRPTGSPEDAFDALPPSLWWPVIATIARLFPGLTPESFVTDIIGKRSNLYEAPTDAAGAFEDLCVRTRSLLAVDWRYTREIHGLIRERLGTTTT
ncbi:MAG: hypothetical protein AAGB51_11525 [Planctomycetota bacterium]